MDRRRLTRPRRTTRVGPRPALSSWRSPIPAGTPLHYWNHHLTEGRTSGIRKVFKLKPGDTYTGTVLLSEGRLRHREDGQAPPASANRPNTNSSSSNQVNPEVARRVATAKGLRCGTPLARG